MIELTWWEALKLWFRPMREVHAADGSWTVRYKNLDRKYAVLYETIDREAGTIHDHATGKVREMIYRPKKFLNLVACFKPSQPTGRKS